jgi:hypothetical protein|eukprot:SAG25_NODE_596_length_6668_cov_212.169889_6_plen_100_part_00
MMVFLESSRVDLFKRWLAVSPKLLRAACSKLMAAASSPSLVSILCARHAHSAERLNIDCLCRISRPFNRAMSPQQLARVCTRPQYQGPSVAPKISANIS